MRLNRHYNKHLQAAYNKYGFDNFKFLILEETQVKENLIRNEQFYIDKYNASDSRYGYNKSPTAGSPLGVKHSVEVKAKLGERSKNIIRTKEWSDNISKSLTGKKATVKHRQNISNSLKGRTLSLEHTSKIAAYQRNLDKWPHLDGYLCKCGECKAKYAERTRNRRLKLKNGE